MSTGITSFQPRRLTQARNLRRLHTVTALADISGISKQMISRYESGTGNPTEERLVTLSEVLNLPIEFFLAPVPARNDRPIFYRSLQSALERDRRRAENLIDIGQEVASFVDEYIDLPPNNIPIHALDQNPRLWTEDWPEWAAKQTREAFGFPSGPLPNLTILVERMGILIIRTELAENELDGLSRWDGSRPIIILNATKSAARSRFDLAHEIGHLVMHSQFGSIENADSIKGLHRDMERQAHRFAAALLLPADEFSHDLWTYNLDEFVSLKHKWQVSAQAMLQRASDLHLVSADHYVRMRKQVSARRWRVNEPMEAVVRLETPSVLRDSLEIVATEVPGGIDLISQRLPFGNLLNEVASTTWMPAIQAGTSTNMIDIRDFQRRRNPQGF